LSNQDMLRVSIESEKTAAFLAQAPAKLLPLLEKDINETTIFALRRTKETVRRRSGNTANSYRDRKLGRLSKEVYSTLASAKALEDGSKPHVIKPKPGRKYLTIPLNDSVLTSTKAQIKRSAISKFWRVVKQAQKDDFSPFEAFQIAAQESGVAMAKKVNHPGFKGTKDIAKRVVPGVSKYLQNKVELSIRKVM